LRTDSLATLEARSREIVYGIILTMVILGAGKDPVKPVAIAGSFVARLGYEVTHQPALLLYSVAFSSNLGQGAAHHISDEQATLLKLEKAHADDQDNKLSFQWAHVVFFPTMTMHALHATLLESSAARPRRRR